MTRSSSSTLTPNSRSASLEPRCLVTRSLHSRCDNASLPVQGAPQGERQSLFLTADRGLPGEEPVVVMGRMCKCTCGPGRNGETCGMSEQPVRFPIRFGALKPLLVLVGLTPRRCYAEVGPDAVRVRMSWSFRADVPRAAIRSAHRL